MIRRGCVRGSLCSLFQHGNERFACLHHNRFTKINPAAITD
jgi:hypothetical protein